VAQRSIAISKFKAECLGLLDEVAETGEELVVTKRGKPIARVVPVEEPPSLKGSVTFAVSDEELIAPVEPAWEAESS
jgi:prevent-host-death family protein